MFILQSWIFKPRKILVPNWWGVEKHHWILQSSTSSTPPWTCLPRRSMAWSFSIIYTWTKSYIRGVYTSSNRNKAKICIILCHTSSRTNDMWCSNLITQHTTNGDNRDVKQCKVIPIPDKTTNGVGSTQDAQEPSVHEAVSRPSSPSARQKQKRTPPSKPLKT